MKEAIAKLDLLCERPSGAVVFRVQGPCARAPARRRGAQGEERRKPREQEKFETLCDRRAGRTDRSGLDEPDVPFDHFDTLGR